MKKIKSIEESCGLSVKKIEMARDRLLANKSMFVAVQGEQGEPELGVSTFVRLNECIFVYTSHLSRHVRYLLNSKTAVCLLCEDECSSQNIWARCRLKFNVSINEVSRSDRRFDKLCDEFIIRHGSTMKLIRNFTDFHMLSFTPIDGVLVIGFAKAFKVEGSEFKIVSHLKEA